MNSTRAPNSKRTLFRKARPSAKTELKAIAMRATNIKVRNATVKVSSAAAWAKLLVVLLCSYHCRPSRVA